MSYYHDYIVASNNSINENQLNSKKAARSTRYQLKQLLRPLLALVRKDKKNSYRRAPPPDYDAQAIADNCANEILESQIIAEIDRCEAHAGVPVYRDGSIDIAPVFRGQHYIPVHFAKTEAGTFFWTSMMGADSDIDTHGDRNAISRGQQAQLQMPCDRWAQA